MENQNVLRTPSVFSFLSVLLLSIILSACQQLPDDEVVSSGDIEMIGDDIAVGVVISGAASSLTTLPSLVSSANWDAGRQLLSISGRANLGDSYVWVTNAVTNFNLGYVWVRSDGTWLYQAIIRSYLYIPCSIRATTPSATQAVNVSNTPSNCSGGPVSGPNQAPDSVINSPATNQLVSVGQTISFAGTGTDPENNVPFTYLWNFDGAAPNSISATPGNVTFNTAGTFTVSFKVTDSLGMSDPTPATRTITVQVPPQNQAPNSQIISPSTNMTIAAGQSVSFSGVGSDPDFNTPLTYFWNFDGAASNSTQQSPGTITFNNLGTYTVRFRVTDALGLSDQSPDTRTITVVPNTAPNGSINSPSSNITVNAGTSINFSGSGTDAENNLPLTYLWNFDGAAPNSTSPTPGNITFNTARTYTISLTVTDSLGLSDPSPATRTITVQAAQNQAPNSQILSPSTNMTIAAGQSVSFSGVGSDPDFNTPLTYLWNFNGAAPNSTQQSPGVITFNNPGTYTVQFFVTDAHGLSDQTPDTRIITVTNANTAPNGSINNPSSNVTINAGGSVYFSGSGTDAENNLPLTYLWNFNGAAPNSTSSTPGNVTFNAAGTYTVSLTVTDSLGLSDPSPATRTITVLAGNNAPNATITSPNIGAGTTLVMYRGESLYFSGTGSDPDGDAITYAWNFNGIASNSTLQNPGTVVLNTTGNYRITLTVTDSKGLSDPTPAEVNISIIGIVTDNQPPVGTISLPATDMTINVGQAVEFYSSATDPDGNTPLHYHWSFGGAVPDGMIQNPGSVTFTRPGMYHVRMTATDSLGLSDPNPPIRMITVRDPNQGYNTPNGVIVTPTSNQVIAVGDVVSFSGTGTSPNGGALSYFWDFGGAAPPSRSQTPGNVTFLNSGTYSVRLYVTDSLGWTDPTPAEVTVTVQAFTTTNQAPNGTIVSPMVDVTIFQGDVVNFAGSAYDVDGNTPLTYQWNFNGGATNSAALSPGNVTFNVPGTYVVHFTPRDSRGLNDPTPAQRVVTVLPLSSNQSEPNSVIFAPTANTIINAGQSVYFSGYATDPNNGTPFTYHWDFNGAAPASTVATPGNVTFYTPGIYVVRLHVWDRDGLWDPTPDERVITVLDPNGGSNNQAPNGVITSPSNDRVINIGDSINFTSTGTDPEGNLPLSYRWSFDGIMLSSIAQNPGVVTFNRAGTFRVTLRVTDSRGLSDPIPAERIITVKANTTNLAPSAQIASPTSNLTIAVNGVVNFSGTGNDPDGNYPLRYYWDFGGATPNVYGQTPGNVTFPNAGTYVVTLRTIDSRGLSSTTVDQRTITVSGGGGGNQSPTATISSPIGTQSITAGGSVYFSGTGYDPDGNTPLTYIWTFGGAAPNSSLQTPGYVTFSNAGTYVVQLTVRDSLGAMSAPASVTINVSGSTLNNAPNGTIMSPTSDFTIARNSYVYFSGSAIDPDGDSVTYFWNIGGAYSSLQNPGSYLFTYPGTYYISLTVTDSKGASDPTPAQRTIVVY